MRIEHQAEITAPPEAVWRLTTDIERWPDLLDAMTSLRRLDEGPLRVGITSGASTPDRVVEDVIGRLIDLADA